MLDGGIYRLEVENKMDSKEWVPPGDKELSYSLSKSLDRLIKKEVIVSIEIQMLKYVGSKTLDLERNFQEFCGKRNDKNR